MGYEADDCLQISQKTALRMSTTLSIMESTDDTSTPHGLIIGRIHLDAPIDHLSDALFQYGRALTRIYDLTLAITG